MAYRTLEITLIDAKDLKDVNHLSRLQIYAVVSLPNDSQSKKQTTTDKQGGRNPTWNHTVRLNIPADDAGYRALRILLRAERALGDRDVGEVFIPLRDFLTGAADGPKPKHFVSYQVRRPSSGRAQGVINLSYKLGGRIGANPTSANPAFYGAVLPPYPVQCGYAAPPYQAVYGYPLPTSYGCPAPPQVVQPGKSYKLGIGLGAGIIGAALIRLGRMISDDAGDAAGSTK